VAVRNVFGTDRDFTFTVDHPAFSVANPRATIKAKESANVAVKYTGGGSPVDAAKLLVACPSVPDMPPWVFYLRGKAP
jgi:hypothetical protein